MYLCVHLFLHPTYIYNLRNSRAKCDDIVRSVGASESAVLVIVSIGISLRALFLEEPRVVRWWTCLRLVVCSFATILIISESQTSTFATDHTAIRPFHLKFCRARSVDVAPASRAFAFPTATLWGYGHRDVEPVHVAHVVEILPSVLCNRYFYQSCRWISTCAVARDLTGAAICCGATEPSVVVRASCSGPEPT
ncbi:hypothetical protein V8G54_031102 [Vigna mungo]|uniref:Uncharacterized protein n=1 Tax=Vigna mungo TaxID=3915 RepID=A0AAQ3RLV8_VIGMU